MEHRTRVVPVQLADGQRVHIEAVSMGGEQDVAIGLPSFDEVTRAIEGISTALAGTLPAAGPTRASIEFGVQVAIEAGQLTALLAKGSAQATLKVTLEWEAK